MKNQIVIESDNLYILDRLKEIDESYFLVFNLDRKKFEVHSSDQRMGTYCFAVPYDSLDERTILFARKTRISRRDELIKQMDRENEKLEKKMYRDAVDHLKEVL